MQEVEMLEVKSSNTTIGKIGIVATFALKMWHHCANLIKGCDVATLVVTGKVATLVWEGRCGNICKRDEISGNTAD